MRHYECVLLFHPNQSERVPEMIERYSALVKNDYEGDVSRAQDLGRKKLYYTIKRAKASKAHFAVFNIACSDEALGKLKSNFRFNDAVMRYLIIQRKDAVSDPCAPLLEKDERLSGQKLDRSIYGRDFKACDVYLNIALLREHTMETGRIVPARITGVSAKQQRQVSQAIKLARYLGLMPYCDRHS